MMINTRSATQCAGFPARRDSFYCYSSSHRLHSLALRSFNKHGPFLWTRGKRAILFVGVTTSLLWDHFCSIHCFNCSVYSKRHGPRVQAVLIRVVSRPWNGYWFRASHRGPSIFRRTPMINQVFCSPVPEAGVSTIFQVVALQRPEAYDLAGGDDHITLSFGCFDKARQRALQLSDYEAT